MIWRDLSEAPGRAARAAEVLLLGAAVALATGLLEVAILGVQHLVLGEIIFASRDLVWMTPLSYLLLFAFPAVALALLAAVSARIMPLHVAGFCFVALGVGSQFLPFTQVHRLAALLLAVGLAVQAARWIRAHRGRAITLARRGALGMIVLTIVLGAGARAWRVVGERRAVASLPESRQGAPNVLLIIWDTARAASLSLHGHPRRTTPMLEAWAADATVFEQAMATSPWTLPSHGSLFTGRYPHELTADWYVPFDDSTPTLAEAFAARGYVTGGFVANHHYTSYDSGLDRGFQRYEDYRVSFGQVMHSSWLGQARIVRQLLRGDIVRALQRRDFSVQRKRDSDSKSVEQVNADFLAWLDESRAGNGDRPFFAFLNYMEAHLGPPIPDPYAGRFPSDTPMVQRYDGALAYLDHEMGRLLEELRRRGVYDSTLVIFTSDHGELLGEHGIYGHAHNLYLPVLHVPLVISQPGRVPGGVRVSAPVTLGDVAATVVDLAELDPPQTFPGASLARYWRDTASAGASERLLSELRAIDVNVEPHLPSAKGSMRSVRVGSWRYIRNGDGSEELYDLATDPGEMRNLAREATAAAELVRLRALAGEMPATMLAARPAP